MKLKQEEPEKNTPLFVSIKTADGEDFGAHLIDMGVAMVEGTQYVDDVQKEEEVVEENGVSESQAITTCAGDSELLLELPPSYLKMDKVSISFIISTYIYCKITCISQVF